MNLETNNLTCYIHRDMSPHIDVSILIIISNEIYRLNLKRNIMFTIYTLVLAKNSETFNTFHIVSAAQENKQTFSHILFLFISSSLLIKTFIPFWLNQTTKRMKWKLSTPKNQNLPSVHELPHDIKIGNKAINRITNKNNKTRLLDIWYSLNKKKPWGKKKKL